MIYLARREQESADKVQSMTEAQLDGSRFLSLL